jgi:hypothetical protein
LQILKRIGQVMTEVWNLFWCKSQACNLSESLQIYFPI